MKNKFLAIIIAFVLSGCGTQMETTQESKNSISEESIEEGKALIDEKQVQEKVEDSSNETEGNIEKDSPSKKTVTFEEFDSMFQQDPEEKQYFNGEFQLKNGSIVNADYLSYGESELFDYTMAIFYEGNLVEFQMETDATVEEIENVLGISFEDAQVEKYRFGFEVTFNNMFHDTNISIYPFEWE